jgi:hypothetical protein
MKKLYIKETLNSPKVLLDPTKKRYEISGKSFPENSKTFYQPVFDWMDEAAAEIHEKIQLSLTFEYVSSSSIISLKQLLTRIKAHSEKGANIQVLWHYDADDPDIKEIGQEYRKLIPMDLQLVEEKKS